MYILNITEGTIEDGCPYYLRTSLEQRKDGQSRQSRGKKFIIYRPEIVLISLLYVEYYIRKIEYIYMLDLL